MKKLFLPAALLVCGFAFAQNSKPPKAPTKGPEAELNKLMEDFGSAQNKYYEPLMKKGLTDEERSKIKLDPKKDPRNVFVPKFKALAQRNGKSTVAFRAWMQVFQLGTGTTDKDQAINAIVKGWAGSDRLADLAMPVLYSYYELGEKRQAKVLATLDKIDKVAKGKETKAAFIYARASALGNDGSGDLKAARAALDKLMSEYPESQYAARAKADIFELENLSVGKVAPDFTAVDQDGVTFKLSDYRGQVIVLDFWGFW